MGQYYDLNNEPSNIDDDYDCLSSSEEEWIYIHGHASVAYPSSGSTIHFPIGDPNPSIYTSEEVVVSNNFTDEGCYKYEIFTFSESYADYYFLYLLNLGDPVRSNLRDHDQNVVKGSFGSINKKIMLFSVINPD